MRELDNHVVPPKPADDKPKRFFRRRKAKGATKSKDSEQPRTRAERVLRDPEATKKLADDAEKMTTGARGP
jgi:hypothetical protein